MKPNVGKGEIAIYESKGVPRLEVRLEKDNIWMSQAQIVELFESSKANICEHIKSIYDTGELAREATVRKFRTVRKEGQRDVARDVDHFNLDMVISIGYRVNSKRNWVRLA